MQPSRARTWAGHLYRRARRRAAGVVPSRRGELPHAGDDHDTAARALYVELLGREPDAGGQQHVADLLRRGRVVDAVTMLTRSAEHVALIGERHFPLPSLRDERPASFLTLAADDGAPVDVFRADTEADLDWMNERIRSAAYYERPAPWFDVSKVDVEGCADVVAGLGVRTSLELGCGSGAVVDRLASIGIDAYGVDVSNAVVRNASPELRRRILIGDFLTIEVPVVPDAICVLDFLEHLTPTTIDAFLDRAATVLAPDGLLVANIPAFGADDVFGEVFPLFLPSWRDDATAGRWFRDIQVDASGFPLFGHLTWATVGWWTQTLARHGFTRDHELERAIQRKHAALFEVHPSRRSMFVLRSNR